MKAKSKPVLPAARADETRLLEGLFDRPERLRERLILAVALAPPKGGGRSSAFRLARRRK